MKHRVWFSTTTTHDEEEVDHKRNTIVFNAVFGGNLLSQRVDAKVCQYTVEDWMRDSALEKVVGRLRHSLVRLCEVAEMLRHV